MSRPTAHRAKTIMLPSVQKKKDEPKAEEVVSEDSEEAAAPAE